MECDKASNYVAGLIQLVPEWAGQPKMGLSERKIFENCKLNLKSTKVGVDINFSKRTLAREGQTEGTWSHSESG